MRNAKVKTMQVAGSDALVALLGKARLEEKKTSIGRFLNVLQRWHSMRSKKSFQQQRLSSCCAKRRNALSIQRRRSSYEPRHD